MAKKSSQKRSSKVKVHELLGSLSYWGTTARFLFVSVFIAAAFVLNLSGDNLAQYVDKEIMFFILGLATLLMLDLGYVVSARALPINPMADRWAVMISDMLLAALFIIPSLFQITADGDKVRIAGVLIALLIITGRALVGLLFSKRK